MQVRHNNNQESHAAAFFAAIIVGLALVALFWHYFRLPVTPLWPYDLSQG